MELSVVARCPHQNLCQKCFHFLVSANSKKASWRGEKETSVLLKDSFSFYQQKQVWVVTVKVFVTCSRSPWVLLDAKWLQGELQIRLQEGLPQQEVTSRKVIGLDPSSTKGFIFAKSLLKGTCTILLSGKFWQFMYDIWSSCVYVRQTYLIFAFENTTYSSNWCWLRPELEVTY